MIFGDVSLAGLVWAAFMGMAIGNYATNPIYRLPRKEVLFGREPYCGDCNATLVAKDLFPIFSWLWTKGKCRYCGASIPQSYLWIEVLVTAIFVAAYLRFSFSEPMLLIGFGMTGMLMLAAMEYHDKFFSYMTLVGVLFLGALYRVLDEQTLFGFLMGGFVGLMLGWVIARARGQAETPNQLPGYVWLLVVAGVWMDGPKLAYFVPLLLVSMLFTKALKWPFSAAMALAMTGILLFANEFPPIHM